MNWFNSFYDAYFAQCAPSSCTYTYIKRNGPLVIFITILGLFGGLTIALRILVPLVVYFVY